MSEHTQIWSHTDFMGGKARNGKRSIITRDGEGVAETMAGGEEGRNDAALIVRAVNSHAELLKALRRIDSLLHDANMDMRAVSARSVAAAALAKAEAP